MNNQAIARSPADRLHSRPSVEAGTRHDRRRVSLLAVLSDGPLEDTEGRLNLYGQQLDEGYSAPGQVALSDTQQYGGRFGMPLTDQLRLDAKADRLVAARGERG